MGGEAGSTLGNVFGRVLGVLSALPSRGGGFSNLANYLERRQLAMSDPNRRAALTPFSAGFYNIGGGYEPGPAGPPTVGAVAAPADFMGPTIPTPAGPAQSLFVQPGAPGPRVWKPHLPGLAPEAEVEQAQYRQLVTDLQSPDVATRARAKQTAKIPLTQEENQVLVADAGQFLRTAPPGSTASVGPGGVTVTVGSPYPQGTYVGPEGAAVPGHTPPVQAPGGGYKPGDPLRANEFLTAPEAAARRQPDEQTVPTNRGTYENIKVEQKPVTLPQLPTPAPPPAAPAAPVQPAAPPAAAPAQPAPPPAAPPAPPPVVQTAPAPPPPPPRPATPPPPIEPPPTWDPNAVVPHVIVPATPPPPPPGTVAYPSPAFALSAAPPPGAVAVGLPAEPLPQITPTTQGMVQPVAQVTPTTGGPPAQLPVYPAAGFVFHHSGGSTLEGLRDTLKKRGLGSQYLMDRDGTIYSFAGAGSPHIRPNDQFGGIAPGLSNKNAVGMEIVAKDDRDVTPAQVESARRFMAANYPNVNPYGHGEINPGHKQADEGMTVVRAIRGDRGVAVTAGAPTAPAPTPGPVPRAPGTVDLTAPVFRQIEHARNLPPGTISGMAEKESGGNPKAASASSSARGLFQITKDTARAWGISANDRYDPIRSAIATADQIAQRAQSVGIDRAIGMHYGGPNASYVKPIAGQSPAAYSADVQRRAAKYAGAVSPAELGLVAFPSPAPTEPGATPVAVTPAVVAPVPVAPAPEVLMTPVPRRPSLLGGMPPAMLPPEPVIGYPPPAPTEPQAKQPSTTIPLMKLPPVVAVAPPAVPTTPTAPAPVPGPGGTTLSGISKTSQAGETQTFAPPTAADVDKWGILRKLNITDPRAMTPAQAVEVERETLAQKQRAAAAEARGARLERPPAEALAKSNEQLVHYRNQMNRFNEQFPDPEEHKKYIGEGKMAWEDFWSRFREPDPRYEAFHAALAPFGPKAFAEAGAALSPQEAELVMPNIPTGRERTWTEFEIKRQNFTDSLDDVLAWRDLTKNLPAEQVSGALMNDFMEDRARRRFDARMTENADPRRVVVVTPTAPPPPTTTAPPPAAAPPAWEPTWVR